MSTILNIEKPLKIDTDTRRRDAAYSRIQHFIQANQLQPGGKLPPVRKLSDHFGLSRDSVWRALRQLNEDDWLEALPNKLLSRTVGWPQILLRCWRIWASKSRKPSD
ncbi:MAG: GntR family transcriptional regulator [Verrucomicrobia bacterium]|nr:GntR family transcriptional regulator [Verrucomicrobiota bacterium]MCH8528639.1 GntR family transcriptional regulator [Kiritimatiellia bacterium]